MSKACVNAERRTWSAIEDQSIARRTLSTERQVSREQNGQPIALPSNSLLSHTAPKPPFQIPNSHGLCLGLNLYGNCRPKIWPWDVSQGPARSRKEWSLIVKVYYILYI